NKDVLGTRQVRQLIGGPVDSRVTNDRDRDPVALGVGEAQVLAVDLRHRPRPAVHLRVAEDEGALLAKGGIGILAVHVVGGGEDHARLLPPGALEHGLGALGVDLRRLQVAVVAGELERGNVKDGRRADRGLLHRPRVDDVRAMEMEGGMRANVFDVRLPAQGEVVDAHDFVAALEQGAREMGADEAGDTGHHHPCRHPRLPSRAMTERCQLIVRRRPSSRSTRGSKPRTSRALPISGTRARTSSYRPKAWYDTRWIFGSPVPASRQTRSASDWIVTGFVFPMLKISPTARAE